MPPLGLCVQLAARMTIGLPCTGDSGSVSAGSLLAGILASHGFRALTLPIGAHMGLALALLLGGPTVCFLLLGASQVALVAPLSFIFRCAGLLQRDGDCLT